MVTRGFKALPTAKNTGSERAGTNRNTVRNLRRHDLLTYLLKGEKSVLQVWENKSSRACCTGIALGYAVQVIARCPIGNKPQQVSQQVTRMLVKLPCKLICAYKNINLHFPMDLSNIGKNVALARELADGSDYNSALTYYEMTLSFMAK
eukprot:1156781-Pelagomonas_calceolata.AAC.10